MHLEGNTFSATQPHYALHTSCLHWKKSIHFGVIQFYECCLWFIFPIPTTVLPYFYLDSLIQKSMNTVSCGVNTWQESLKHTTWFLSLLGWMPGWDMWGLRTSDILWQDAAYMRKQENIWHFITKCNSCWMKQENVSDTKAGCWQ